MTRRRVRPLLTLFSALAAALFSSFMLSPAANAAATRTCDAQVRTAVTLQDCDRASPAATPPPGLTSAPRSDGSDDASASSPYILASGPADAERKLSALASRLPGVHPLDVQYGPCVLKPSNVYLRKSWGYGAVGTKPQTTCTTAVTSIHHDTELHYAWYLWWPSAGTWSGSNTGVAAYTQRNVAYSCVGDTTTTWQGTTLGTIVYGGHTYYARVYTPQAELDCEA
jgi:hypothetical protein